MQKSVSTEDDACGGRVKTETRTWAQGQEARDDGLVGRYVVEDESLQVEDEDHQSDKDPDAEDSIG